MTEVGLTGLVCIIVALIMKLFFKAKGGFLFFAAILFVGGGWAFAGGTFKPSTAVAVGAGFLAIGALALLTIEGAFYKIVGFSVTAASLIVLFLALPVGTQNLLKQTGSTSSDTGGTVLSMLVTAVQGALTR